MTRTFTVGERVAALRNKQGTVLDYSGTVEAVEEEPRRLTIRFSDGETVTMTGHPDYVMKASESANPELFGGAL